MEGRGGGEEKGGGGGKGEGEKNAEKCLVREIFLRLRLRHGAERSKQGRIYVYLLAAVCGRKESRRAMFIKDRYGMEIGHDCRLCH